MMEDPRISGTRRPPAHLRDIEFRRDERGVKRILVDGRKPIYEKDGKYYCTYGDAVRAGTD
jgi:hypothetical protein